MIVPILGKDHPILKEEMPAFDFQNPIMDPVELYINLAETMRENEGMGLSANQIGVRTRAFVMRAEEIIGVFNPRVVDISSETVMLEEGCLSYPNLFVKIKRPKSIKVRFTTPDGETSTKTFTGMTARVFLHELDHLNGIAHTSRANRYHLEQAKKLLKKLKNKRMSSVPLLSDEASVLMTALHDCGCIIDVH
jgi:peptide deformylase